MSEFTMKIILKLKENQFPDYFHVSVKNKDDENLSVPFLRSLKLHFIQMKK